MAIKFVASCWYAKKIIKNDDCIQPGMSVALQRETAFLHIIDVASSVAYDACGRTNP